MCRKIKNTRKLEDQSEFLSYFLNCSDQHSLVSRDATLEYALHLGGNLNFQGYMNMFYSKLKQEKSMVLGKWQLYKDFTNLRSLKLSECICLIGIT